MNTHSRRPPKAPLPHVATAAPLGHAASSRMRGADALAQALDLLANHRGISHDRRLGDHARVMQVEDARAAARAPVLGAVARVLARRAPSQQADLRASCARDATLDGKYTPHSHQIR